MAEWTPESKEFFESYLTQVRILARQAGEDGDEITSGLRDHVAAKSEDEAGPLLTLDVLRRILAEIGSPEAIIESGASWKAAPAATKSPAKLSVPSPALPAQPSVDRSGKFVRWTLGCVLALVALLIAVPVLSIMAAIFLPAIARSRAAAGRSECQNHLKQIGQAIERWEEDHPGESKYPQKLSDIYPKYINNLEVFACPSSPDGDRAPDRLDMWSAYEFNVGWLYEGTEPIIQEKVETNHLPEGRNVLYNNGHVEFARKAELAFVDPSTNTLIPVHTDNAESVARAFLIAMSTKKFSDALQYVQEEQRNNFTQYNRISLGGTNFELKSEHLADNKVEVRLVESQTGVDLIFGDGRWWVVNWAPGMFSPPQGE